MSPADYRCPDCYGYGEFAPASRNENAHGPLCVTCLGTGREHTICELCGELFPRDERVYIVDCADGLEKGVCKDCRTPRLVR